MQNIQPFFTAPLLPFLRSFVNENSFVPTKNIIWKTTHKVHKRMDHMSHHKPLLSNIFEEKMEFWSLQNPNIRPPTPLASLTAKSWHIHTLHTLWAPLNTEQWVDTRQKTLHTLMCVSAGTQSWHWQIKKEGSHQQYSAYSVIKTQCSSQQSQNGQEKLGAVCSRGELGAVWGLQCAVCNVGRCKVQSAVWGEVECCV